MPTRAWSLALDAAMLAAVVLLNSWRLTGVPLHERIGVALGAVLVVHVLHHFPWIASGAARLRTKGARRNRVNVALNGALFVAMAAALASGLFMSKSLFPGFQAVAEYLKWHEIHETSSNAVLILVGLHLALNWERVTSGVRRALGRGSAPSAAAPAAPAAAGLSFRRGALVAGAAAAVALGVFALQHALPAEANVLVVERDGRRHLEPPPQAIAALRKDQLDPDPARGGGRAVLRFGIVCAVAVAGRTLLKLRLE